MKLAVLGAGPGGYVAALKAAQMGADVTVIEDAEVGGTCLNWGCIPTKTLIASSDLLSRAREMGKFGIEMAVEPVPNMTKIMERKNKVVSTQIKGIRGLLRSRGIVLKEGRGTIKSPSRLEVALRDGTTENVDADRIIIATGSRPAAIPALPFDGTHVISSNEATALSAIPKSLLIVGAGVIGCEFAGIYKELGAEITIVEAMDRAIATEDHEISELLQKELRKKKIKLLTGVSVSRVEVDGDAVRAFLSDGKELVAEKVLVSVGRAFNSRGIGIETIGVATGGRGEIIVNNRMETNIAGVYAVGDITGGLMLAHVASAQGIVAVRNIMGIDSEIDYSLVPAAIFTSPEIASVGLREYQAEEKGLRIRTGHFEFRALGKAHAMGDIAGFIKIIADVNTDRILGAHIIGPHASDLIHELVVAMKAGLTAQDVSHTIHAHPTLAEGIMEAAGDVCGEAIHAAGK